MQGLMLAVLKDRQSPGVSIKKVKIPKPGKDEILVKIHYASICGTDLSLYNWSDWAKKHAKTPLIMGHELVGEVVQIYGKTTLKLGDLVSSETHIFCNKCSQCNLGRKHTCEKVKLFGININGGFAEYAVLPIKTAWKNNPRLSPEIMVIQEPLGNAMHVVTKAHVKNKVVGIFGLGPIGICASLIAKSLNSKEVYAIDPSAYRRQLAGKMGLNKTFPDLPRQFIGKTDVVLEMSGHPSAIQNIPKALKNSGQAILFGLPKNEVPINIGSLIDKEISTQGVFGREIWDSWYQTQNIIKKVDFSKLITHKFKLSEFEKAIEIMKSGNCGKILLKP